MIRAHQPGSESIDIPETIPNPVVVPKPLPYSDRTRSQGTSSDPGEGSLARDDFRQISPACINAVSSRITALFVGIAGLALSRRSSKLRTAAERNRWRPSRQSE
jgi:hypothetical protein